MAKRRVVKVKGLGTFNADWLDLSEASSHTALVMRSVLPVFNHEAQRPERLGTALLVLIDGHPFVLTAAHVIAEAQKTTRRFALGLGGNLLALHQDRFVTVDDDAADIGLIPLRPPTTEVFRTIGGVFLDSERLDENEEGDGLDVLNTLEFTYFALGFPASRSHSRVRHASRKIDVRGYGVDLTLAPTNEYPDGLFQDQHILLDYDTKQIRLDGQNVNPPMSQGMSGGGVFRFRRRQPETTKLVGVLIEHHKRSRILAATRLGVAMSLGREVIARFPEALR